MPDPIPPSLHLGPPQFGLRTMLLIVSSVAVLLGLSQWMSPISFAALLLLILSIIAHVAGNVIGTRLKEVQRARKKEEPEEPRASLRSEHFAPTTKLGGRQSLGWLPLGCGIGGFVIGAILGCAWTAYLLGSEFDWGTLALAALAFGALGGIGGFLVVGFSKAFWDAWQQASS
jgi:hypothetical protein